MLGRLLVGAGVGAVGGLAMVPINKKLGDITMGDCFKAVVGGAAVGVFAGAGFVGTKGVQGDTVNLVQPGGSPSLLQEYLPGVDKFLDFIMLPGPLGVFTGTAFFSAPFVAYQYYNHTQLTGESHTDESHN